MATRRPHPTSARGNAKPRPTDQQKTTQQRTTQQRTTQQKTTRTKTQRTSGRRRATTLRLPLGDHRVRLRLVLVALGVVMSLCAGRLLQLQGFDSAAYGAISSQALTRNVTILPTRGEILDRNGGVLASSEPAVNITADPTLTSARAEDFAAVLGRYLDQSNEDLVKALTKTETRFVVIAKGVPAATYSKISTELDQQELYGVFRETAPVRTYPNGSLAAGLLGFVNGSNVGQGGLESELDQQLTGTAGTEKFEASPGGTTIPLGTNVVEPATDGTTYTTTIDQEVQWVAERELAAQLKKSRGSSGFVIVQNIKTGEILAMANAPSYDPAKITEADAKAGNLGNRAVTEPYEPGSVEKVLTSAALLDAGTVTPDTHVEVGASIASGGGDIKDYVYQPDRYTMRGVIAHSSNIGTVEMTRQLDKAKLHDYLASFGLGRTTALGLPGEAAGTLPPADMKDYTRDQIAFGQAMTVTGVQMSTAISAILNDGIYHEPSVMKSTTSADGTTTPVARATPRRVVKESTSRQVQDLMQAVVYNAPRGLAMAQYATGGKTGTAERVSGKSRVYNSFTSSYVGYAPLDDPQFLTYVVVADPKGDHTGSGNAAPVFKNVMGFVLPRYGVTPTTKPVQEKALTY